MNTLIWTQCNLQFNFSIFQLVVAYSKLTSTKFEALYRILYSYPVKISIGFRIFLQSETVPKQTTQQVISQKNNFESSWPVQKYCLGQYRDHRKDTFICFILLFDLTNTQAPTVIMAKQW